MRDDYKIEGAKIKIEVEIEAVVAARLEEMSRHTKLTVAEITNTALKRFIAGHKDFLPQNSSRAG